MEKKLYIAEFEEAEGNAEKEMELWRNHSTMYRAYLDSKKAGNDVLNFYETIWEKDIESIIDLCRKNNMDEITISGISSNMLEILAGFEKYGCKLNGLASAKDRFNGQMVPALAVRMR